MLSLLAVPYNFEELVRLKMSNALATGLQQLYLGTILCILCFIFVRLVVKELRDNEDKDYIGLYAIVSIVSAMWGIGLTAASLDPLLSPEWWAWNSILKMFP